MTSIFIQIPAYRDFELPHTVADAIAKASGDIKISFGIHNCILFKGETTVQHLQSNFAKINYIESIAPNNIGLQKARKIANEMYNGEEYYLQIDSHMRFVKNWDIINIENLNNAKKIGIQKPLITMYPATYGYNENGKEFGLDNAGYIGTISFKENPGQFKSTLLPTQTATPIEDGCLYTPSVSGGYIFTTGGFSLITPNEKIAFWGEEPLIAARAFTHGFTLIVPDEHTIWHLYGSNQQFKFTRRYHPWSDFPELWNSMYKQSMDEYKRIFSERVIGPEALGNVRTLEEYEQFSGLNFATGKIS
jgi:hypothetical protein